MSITADRKHEVIADNARTEGDTGSAEVQVAIDLRQVVKKATTLRDHLEQAAARVVVLLVGLEVLGEVGDAFRKDRDLDLGRTGVALGAGVVGDDFVLAFSSDRHRVGSIWSPLSSGEIENAVGFQPAGPQLTESDEGLALKG